MIEIKSKFYNSFNYEFFKHDVKAADCEVEFEKLLSFLSTYDVYVGRAGKGETSYKKLNILKKFSELFNDKFKFYTDEFYEIKKDLNDLGISCNLAEELSSKSSCYNFSQTIFTLSQKYDSLFEIDYDLQQTLKKNNNESNINSVNEFDLIKWKKAISFLKLVSEITQAFSNVTSTRIFINGDDKGKKIHVADRSPINWCSYCFRRASKKGPQRYSQIESTKKKYDLTCRIHNTSNDKIYREAKNRAKFLSEEDRQFINQIHAERIFCELHTSQQQIYVTDEEWLNFGQSWIDALQNVFPNEDLAYISNWNQYVDKFHSLFENNEETTYNPKWIMDIFIEAEMWLNLEKKYPKIDNRKRKYTISNNL